MISKISRKDISLLKRMNMSTADINNSTGNKINTLYLYRYESSEKDIM